MAFAQSILEPLSGINSSIRRVKGAASQQPTLYIYIHLFRSIPNHTERLWSIYTYKYIYIYILCYSLKKTVHIDVYTTYMNEQKCRNYVPICLDLIIYKTIDITQLPYLYVYIYIHIYKQSQTYRYRYTIELLNDYIAHLKNYISIGILYTYIISQLGI